MILRASFTFVVASVLTVTPAMATRVHRAPTSGHSKSTHHIHAPKPKKMHGQQAIDGERATAIQQALIREHYLTGEPTGKWDAETQTAMLKFQGAQGWQTKITPDSRALIKLGLGPDHSGAINASKGSSFNALPAPGGEPVQAQGFVAASGISH